MTPEEKQLLLKDLCGRLPYGINGLHRGEVHTLLTIDSRESANSCIQVDDYDAWFLIDDFKPYLRPMSSMTEEEKGDINNIIHEFGDKWFESGTPDNHWSATFWECSEITDYLLSHYLDFRGLIPMGLALEATEGMYKF